MPELSHVQHDLRVEVAQECGTPACQKRLWNRVVCPRISQLTIANKTPRTSNKYLIPLWFIGLIVPFAIAGVVLPIQKTNDYDSMPGAVTYVYITAVGQCYRLVAGGLNLYAYLAGKPLLSFLGPQPKPDLDLVFPFFLDFTVGFSSIIIAATFAPHPLFWGALILWVGYGWADHAFAGYRLYFCKRFGPYPRLLLGQLGFEVFVATSVCWQGSNLAMLLLNSEVHRWFGIHNF